MRTPAVSLQVPSCAVFAGTAASKLLCMVIFILPEQTLTQALAIFDLDGTLVRCQTQRCFLEHCRESGLISSVTRLKLLLWFGLYKAGIVSEPRRALEYAYRFAAGWPLERLEQNAAECFNQLILPHLCPIITQRLEFERKTGRHLLLVSNSIEPLVGAIARFLKFDGCIGTSLETENGYCTGRIAGSIVYGAAKVYLVRDYMVKNGLTLTDSIAYADHISDVPLLEIVTRAVAVSPCNKLQAIARQRNWEIVQS